MFFDRQLWGLVFSYQLMNRSQHDTEGCEYVITQCVVPAAAHVKKTCIIYKLVIHINSDVGYAHIADILFCGINFYYNANLYMKDAV